MSPFHRILPRGTNTETSNRTSDGTSPATRQGRVMQISECLLLVPATPRLTSTYGTTSPNTLPQPAR
ncbi:hypothetical protein L207DRAFT_509676 [Hyaloscypha variabilis F]|uniref:Uncharacterized protein n=1 Tax=Hyaloscypha variabilis (strain UAMH 11265 / GT02V1 / F) TaxID=1149755 RepID=A0A2J6RX80_HYAVF|nr:hypothetical protein L207DRAFT_509676 [Hyaloscypha variabilis F]